ncbi:hypothetical protein QM333_11740, partial [Pseudomonas aeruginosa]
MDDHGRSRPPQPTLYRPDTNVPNHQPDAPVHLPEPRGAIP